MEIESIQSANSHLSDSQLPSGEYISTTSASEDTEESGEDESHSDRECHIDCSRKDLKSFNDTDDLLYNSLDHEGFGPFVHKLFSKYSDNKDDEFLRKSQLTKKEHGESSTHSPFGGKTIKAATRHIDEQQGKKATIRQQSQSMIDLLYLDSSPPHISDLDKNVSSTTNLKTQSDVKTTGIRSIIESQYVSFQQETYSPNKAQDLKKKKKRQKKSQGLKTQEGTQELESDANTDDPSIERKSQFSCLPSRPVYRSSLRSNALSSNSIRSLTFHAPDCPLDRVQFYRSFSQLLRKEKRVMNSSFVSNKDPNVGGFIELIYMQELRDLIWLELKAWFDNRSMIDEDSYLCLQRKKIPHTLHKIFKFSISSTNARFNSTHISPPNNEKHGSYNEPLQEAKKCEDPKENNAEVNDLRVLIDQDKLAASVALKLNIVEKTREEPTLPQPETYFSQSPDEENCNCSETLSRLCQFCVDKETNALKQAEEVLAELYEIEHLYPCTKTLAYDYPIYASDQFIARVNSLHLFVNIIHCFRQKIDLLAKLFHITNREVAGWPKFDDSKEETDSKESSEVTPEVKFCSYSYKLNAQAPLNLKVQFKNLPQIVPEDCTSSTNSDLTISGSNSPEIRKDHLMEGSKLSSGNQSSNTIESNPQINIFFQSKYPPSIYRRYVDKALKNKGLRYIYHQLSHILRPILYRVHAALKKPSTYSFVESVGNNCKFNDPHLESKKSMDPHLLDSCDDLSQYGVWSIAYQQMLLPTFHRPFLFLLRVTVDVVHECLRLRLEQQPEKPSSVSIGQLIRECKEVLRAAVLIRQRYVNLAQTVLGEGGSDVIEAQLDSFNDDLKTMLQVYLKYLEQWIHCMQKMSSSTLKQKGYLEEEWIFVRTFAPRIPEGEALAANKFCLMAADLLTFIGYYIQEGIDDCFQTFEESISSANSGNLIGCRKGALESFRKFKSVFQEAGGRVCQATAFAKTLRKDLEIASEFTVLVDTDTFLKKLRDTDHIRVIAPNNPNYLMFVPSYMQGNEVCIWQLVDMTCGGRSADDTDSDAYGYLVVMLHNEKVIDWNGTIVLLEPTAEANVSLSNVQVNGVLFVVSNPSQLDLQYRQFEALMSGTLKINKQQASCNNAITDALRDLKQKALDMQKRASQSLNLILSKLDIERIRDLEEPEKMLLKIRCLDVLHQGFKFGFEYEKALTRLITGESKTLLAKQLIDFALQWIRFVLKKCVKGRGLGARSVSPGLQYLLVALEPQYIQVLSDEEFNLVKTEVDRFVNHLIGSNEKTPKILNPSNLSIQGPCSVLSVSTRKPLASSLNFQRSQSVVNVKGVFGDEALAFLEKSEANKPSKGTRLEEWAQKKTLTKNSRKGLVDMGGECKPLERIQKAIKQFEETRNDKLRERGVIGSVSGLIIQRAPLQIAARRVNFPWQRGFKIGEGRFGKVYTAVNNLTGELIAMKEIHLQPNDHRAIKETIDEIRTFEGIKHPNLVKYFGVEIHREEMYIFMEYCNQGSLESAAQLNLAEYLVRKYTRKLVEALNVLHENGIVHRDIKSANIFLTSDGNLKLGDFGCCMKLKNHTTLPGELNAFVGTPAYMAPEVFTKNQVEGHGRASDIWSLGCVVLEMLTGRRPWHDLDNSYQIMFRVGMGEKPEVPENICEEGKDFIDHCLQHDPRLRLSSSQLLCHPFTKVADDDYL